MDENYQPEAPPAFPDLAAADGCRNVLTGASSVSSSITVDNSKDFIRRNTNARQCMVWTDEKHNSYLSALEASFVEELHQSLGLISGRSGQNTCDPSPSGQLPINASYSSDQFTVLQDGSWQKINFKRNWPSPCSAAHSKVGTGNLRMRHFRCSGKHSVTASADLQEHRMFSSEEMSLRGKMIFSHEMSSSGQHSIGSKCHQYADETVTEVSDQNFVDEDRKEKSMAKRLKMAAADASTKDQIVPSVNLFIAEISTAVNPASEHVDQRRREFVPENTKTLVSTGPKVKSFLRES